MQPVPRTSVIELTVAHLRMAMREGRWSGSLPGVVRLATELDVCRHTIRAALRQLEADGLLGSRGLGRSRRIVAPDVAERTLRRLRVGILLHDAPRNRNLQTSQILLEIQQILEKAGHTVFFYQKTQFELQHDLRRIKHHLGTAPVDALIVQAGSRVLLEWCAEQTLPTMSLYGRTDGLSLARTGPDKLPSYLAATRELIRLGHRRIVLITLRSRRKPTPGNIERAFLDELSAAGILTGDYNLPDWEETPQGYSLLLERLFQRTPPTALIIEESSRFIAASQFLARHRIAVPEQVSLVSTDNDGDFNWCYPGIAHMEWDAMFIVRRIVRWVASIQHGKPDRKTINCPAEFVPNGSIGPVPKGR